MQYRFVVIATVLRYFGKRHSNEKGNNHQVKIEILNVAVNPTVKRQNRHFGSFLAASELYECNKVCVCVRDVVYR